MSILSAAASAMVQGENEQFDTYAGFIAAIKMDKELDKITVLAAADLLDAKWHLPRLRGAWVEEDEGNTYAKFGCRMGGGNRECSCEPEDSGQCGACKIKHLQKHPLFVSDEDEDYDCTFNELTFGPLSGPVPNPKFYAIVVDEGAGTGASDEGAGTGASDEGVGTEAFDIETKKRAYECHGCKARLPHSEDIASLWKHMSAISEWFAKHSNCKEA